MYTATELETLPYLIVYIANGREVQRLFRAHVYADAFMESLAKDKTDAYAKRGKEVVGNTFVRPDGTWGHFLN